MQLPSRPLNLITASLPHWKPQSVWVRQNTSRVSTLWANLLSQVCLEASAFLTWCELTLSPGPPEECGKTTVVGLNREDEDEAFLRGSCGLECGQNRNNGGPAKLRLASHRQSEPFNQRNSKAGVKLDSGCSLWKRISADHNTSDQNSDKTDWYYWQLALKRVWKRNTHRFWLKISGQIWKEFQNCNKVGNSWTVSRKANHIRCILLGSASSSISVQMPFKIVCVGVQDWRK